MQRPDPPAALDQRLANPPRPGDGPEYHANLAFWKECVRALGATETQIEEALLSDTLQSAGLGERWSEVKPLIRRGDHVRIVGATDSIAAKYLNAEGVVAWVDGCKVGVWVGGDMPVTFLAGEVAAADKESVEGAGAAVDGAEPEATRPANSVLNPEDLS